MGDDEGKGEGISLVKLETQEQSITQDVCAADLLLSSFSKTVGEKLSGVTRMSYFASLLDVLLLVDLTEATRPCLVAYQRTGQGCRVFALPLTEEYVRGHVEKLAVAPCDTKSEAENFEVYGKIFGTAFLELHTAVFSDEGAQREQQQQQQQLCLRLRYNFVDDRDDLFILPLVQEDASDWTWRTIMAFYRDKQASCASVAPATGAVVGAKGENTATSTSKRSREGNGAGPKNGHGKKGTNIF